MNSEIVFALNDRISNKEDWNSAYQITQEIYQTWIQDSENKREPRSIGIGCKTFLTTSILLISQTNYPDLLTVKTFLKLPDLQSRLVNIEVKDNGINFGQQVSSHFQGILNFTKDFSKELEIFNAIVTEPFLALDNYLKRNNFTFTESQNLERFSHLNLVI